MRITITVDGDGAEPVIVHGEQLLPAAEKRAPAQWLRALDFTLTDRQIEIVKLVAAGMLYKQIAVELGISVRTVRSHIDAIFGRTGIQNNTMLVTWAWLIGLVKEDDIIREWRDIAPHLVQLA